MGLLLDDSIFYYADDLLYHVKEEHLLLHETIDITEYPQLMYAAFYQDGVIHALERALNMRYSGQYSHAYRLQNIIHTYIDIQKKMRSNGNYENVAYIKGYISGLTYLLLDNKKREKVEFPLYYSFGCKHDIFSIDEYKEHINNNPDAHKASIKHAKKRLKELSDPASVDLHHPPWL